MKFFAALSVALPLVAAKVSYDGYKAFRITSNDPSAVKEALSDISYVSLSVANSYNGYDVAVHPDDIKAFNALGLNTKVMHEDFGAQIASEGEIKSYGGVFKASGTKGGLPDISYFNSYHELADHHQFLDDIQSFLPDNSETFVAGKSVEGRDLKGIHLYGKNGAGKNPAIIWHGNVHAREWITSATIEYQIFEIVQGYKNGTELLVNTLDNYDVYIIPIVNPDGYAYTTSEDRLWRKNRQVRDGIQCVGTDLNRNWPYKWDIEGGSSPDPCEITYRGEAPGDTPENKVLTSHTLKVSKAAGIKWYVDWHSYSQLILLPYGWSCDDKDNVENLERQMELAGGVSKAIEGVNGLSFDYGPTCKTIYLAAGGSMDWVMAKANAELAWGIELRPNSTDNNGFVLSPDNIVPSGKEIWAGVQWIFGNF